MNWYKSLTSKVKEVGSQSGSLISKYGGSAIDFVGKQIHGSIEVEEAKEGEVRAEQIPQGPGLLGRGTTQQPGPEQAETQQSPARVPQPKLEEVPGGPPDQGQKEKSISEEEGPPTQEEEGKTGSTPTQPTEPTSDGGGTTTGTSSIFKTYTKGLYDFIDHLKSEVLRPEEEVKREGQDGPGGTRVKVVRDRAQMRELYYILLFYFEREKLTKITIKKLNEIIAKVKLEEAYLEKDPADLLLLSREDFTSFGSFFRQFKEHRSLQERLFGYDPNFPKEVMAKLGPKQEKQQLWRIMLRFVYLVIFEVTTYLESLDHGGAKDPELKTKVDPTQPGQVPGQTSQVDTDLELKPLEESKTSSTSSELDKVKAELEQIKLQAQSRITKKVTAQEPEVAEDEVQEAVVETHQPQPVEPEPEEVEPTTQPNLDQAQEEEAEVEAMEVDPTTLEEAGLEVDPALEADAISDEDDDILGEIDDFLKDIPDE